MHLKLCPACKQEKVFTLKGTSCKDCAAARSRQHYSKIKGDPSLLEKRRAKANARNKSRKQQAIQYLGGCCFDCKGVFPESVYDFHHVDMTSKEGNPSKFLAGSWEKAQDELAKCVLLCANCHRVRHFEGGDK